MAPKPEIRTRRKRNTVELPNTPDREKGPRRTAAATYPSTGPAEAFNGFVATDFRLDSKAVNTVRATRAALLVVRFPSAQNVSPTRETKARRITGLLFCISATKSFKTSSGTGRFSRR